MPLEIRLHRQGEDVNRVLDAVVVSVECGETVIQLDDRVRAEGLAIRHNEHLIIEDDPVRFADALVQILVDDTLFKRLSTAGMELVKSRYSWEQVARPQAELWRRVAHV